VSVIRSHRAEVDKALLQYFGGASSTSDSAGVAEETLKYHGGMLAEVKPGCGPVLYVQLPLYKEKRCPTADCG